MHTTAAGGSPDTTSSAEDDVARLTGNIEGPLSIGARFRVGEYVILKILGTFNNEHPQVRALLQVTNTEQIVNLVLKQEIDLGLIENQVNKTELVAKPFLQDELIIVIPPDYPLSEHQFISMEDLVALPFVMRAQGSDTRKITKKD